MPSTPTSTLMSRPVIAAPVTSNGPMSQTEERPALAEDAVEDGAAGLEEVDGLPSFARTSTPPAATVVIQRLPSTSILRPSGMWPSGSVWMTLLLAVGRPPDDAQRVGLDPDDRPVGLGDDAVRIDVVELLDDVGVAVLLDDDDPAGMRLVAPGPSRRSR